MLESQMVRVDVENLGDHVGEVLVMWDQNEKVVGRILKVDLEGATLTFKRLCGFRRGDTSTVRFTKGCKVRVFGEDAEVSAFLE